MSIRIEPQRVALAVDMYVDHELRDAKKFDNREPLDESGIYALHDLAAEIYAMAWEDAARSITERVRYQMQRKEFRVDPNTNEEPTR